jgi:molecular chaperone GrpE (heat shock protein)
MWRKSAECQKRENEIYDKIREISDAFDRLLKEGKDTTETLRQLEAALEEVELFRRELERILKRS